MMKIITITQLNAINQAVAQKENNPESRYCETNKHCMLDKYAIPMMDDYLLSLAEYCDFITKEWLTTDVVEELPSDWTWHFDTSIRIIMPVYLVLSNPNLKALIQYCDANNVINITTKTDSFVYVNYIDPSHQALFDAINLEAGEELIKIETK